MTQTEWTSSQIAQAFGRSRQLLHSSGVMKLLPHREQFSNPRLRVYYGPAVELLLNCLQKRSGISYGKHLLRGKHMLPFIAEGKAIWKQAEELGYAVNWNKWQQIRDQALPPRGLTTKEVVQLLSLSRPYAISKGVMGLIPHTTRGSVRDAKIYDPSVTEIVRGHIVGRNKPVEEVIEVIRREPTYQENVTHAQTKGYHF